MKEGRCVFCGGCLALVESTQPGRRDECPQCRGDLHCCRQCRFFAPHYRNDCREPRAELVIDKVKANFCDWFEFQGGSGTPDPEHERAEVAKSRLKELFK